MVALEVPPVKSKNMSAIAVPAQTVCELILGLLRVIPSGGSTLIKIGALTFSHTSP